MIKTTPNVLAAVAYCLAFVVNGQLNTTDTLDFSFNSTEGVTESPTSVPTQAPRTITECGNTQDCTITCSMANECEYTLVLCPNTTGFDYTCTVDCTAEEACLDMQIVAPYSSSLSVTCTATNACKNMEIVAPLSNDAGTTSLTIFTEWENAAKYMTINASDTDSISIDCTGDSSCRYMTLYANNVDTLSLSASQPHVMSNMLIYGEYLVTSFAMTCESPNSCQNQIFYFNYSSCDIDINCDQTDNSCDYNEWYFNENTGNDINILCESCIETIINILYKSIGNTQLICRAEGCDYMDLYIYTTNNTKDNSTYYSNIRCVHDGSCAHMNIYTRYGYSYDNTDYGLEFDCRGNNNEYCNNITVYCGNMYQYSCMIEYNENWARFDNDPIDNGIVCLDKDTDYEYGGICGATPFPSYAPTQPTIQPTDMPSQPSLSPTFNPTMMPTTGMPTMTPTDHPTKSPVKSGSNGSGSGTTASASGFSITGLIIALAVVSVICCICGVLYIKAENKHKDDVDNRRAEKERQAIENLEKQSVYAATNASINNSGNVTGGSGNDNGGDELELPKYETQAQSTSVDSENNNNQQGGGGMTTTTAAGIDANGNVVVNTRSSVDYGASPAIRAHRKKKEEEAHRQALGISEEEEAAARKDIEKDKGKQGYNLVGNDDAFDEA